MTEACDESLQDMCSVYNPKEQSHNLALMLGQCRRRWVNDKAPPVHCDHFSTRHPIMV